MIGPKIYSVSWLLGFICSASSENGSFISDSLQLFLQQPKWCTKMIKIIISLYALAAENLSTKSDNYFKNNFKDKKLGKPLKRCHGKFIY